MKYLEHELPFVIKEFLTYHEAIKGHSSKTCNEYLLDLRLFFRYMKLYKQIVPADTELNSIRIDDIDIDFCKKITLSDIYAFLSFLNKDREYKAVKGVNACARARKVSALRSFYKYLTTKAHLLEENPIRDLDSPKIRKNLPRYLSEEESRGLLSSIKGSNEVRDYAIITLFLNCGLRISELRNINCADIKNDTLRVLGKGNKERILYLNEACITAINRYLAIRPQTGDQKALFISRQSNRVSTAIIHKLVKKHIENAGLNPEQYSSHKLRHTAATLMLQNGVDVRTLQEVLGHEHLNTTQIYTHIDNDSLRLAAKANPLASVKPPPATSDST